MTTHLAIPFVDLALQHESIRDKVLERLTEIIGRSAFILGSDVSEFEQLFAQFCQARHAVGVASGTDALLLALKALDIGLGDEVITAANTFVATAEAIAHAGARPVFVDIDPVSYNIDAAKVEQHITERTRAIIPVHLYGYPADMAAILTLARRHDLYVIEDAAQAHGATYDGRPVGALGDVGCFSFYPSKNLGAFGDGGAVVTNSEETAVRVRELRDHGALRKNEHRRIGFTSRLDAVQAAVLTMKLDYLERWNRMRIDIAGQYHTLLSQMPDVVLPPTCEEGTAHVFHLYVIRLESGHRDHLRDYLESKGISTGIHYPTPVPMTEAFAYLGYEPGAFPVAERYSGQILSLPMYPGLEPEQVTHIAEAITGFLVGASEKQPKGKQ